MVKMFEAEQTPLLRRALTVLEPTAKALPTILAMEILRSTRRVVEDRLPKAGDFTLIN